MIKAKERLKQFERFPELKAKWPKEYAHFLFAAERDKVLARYDRGLETSLDAIVDVFDKHNVPLKDQL